MVTGEKRNSEEERMIEKVTAVLLDIEGTTTSISFVKDKLFPYVRENLQSYIDSHWEEDEFKQDLQALKDLAKKDAEDKVEGLVSIEDGDKEKESLVKNILWQMDGDRKTTALKQLQGHIWRDGYKNGKLKGHIYDDVAACLKKWSEDGRRLFIYSSGSVEAQKLLFGNTEEGDLLEFLAGHYDTEVGPKTESSSYTSIAKSIGCDGEQILFLTDVVKEAKAAKDAGFQTLIVVREGNAELSDEEKQEFVTVSSFKEIVFESSAKKKKISNGEEAEKVEEKVEKKENEAEEKVESKPDEAKTEEKKEVNGGEEKKEAEAEEKMDVDVVVEDEVKPETKEDCKEKTVETTENKTEENVSIKETEESKTESEKPVEVAETKEEEKKPEETAAEKTEEKPVEKEKVEEAKVTEEESVKENKENETPVEENIVKEEEKKKEEKDEKDEKPVEEKKEEEKKEEVKETETKEEKPVENNKEEAETKKEETEKKEVNGTTNGEKNGVLETEEITVKKVIPEEKPDAAVEVKA